MNALSDLKIAVIGLGYVGLPLAVESGKRQSVLGYDLDADRIDELNSYKDRTLEVTTQALKDATGLTYTGNPAELSGYGVYIITVPTPIDSANKPDPGPITTASELVGKHMTAGAIVIYESTMYTGCTEEVCVPLLERASGLTFNQDFFCGYSPERVNPGDKVNTLTKITKITSGSTTETAETVDALYRSIIEGGTYPVSGIRVGEAVKVIKKYSAGSQHRFGQRAIRHICAVEHRYGGSFGSGGQ